MSSSPRSPVVHSDVLLVSRDSSCSSVKESHLHSAYPRARSFGGRGCTPSFVWLPSQYWAQDSVCGTQDPPFYVSHSTLTSQPLPSPSGWGMLRKRQCCSLMNCPVNLMSTSTWPTLGEQGPTFSKLVQHLPRASCVPPAQPTQ